jgi:hypothetical protein
VAKHGRSARSAIRERSRRQIRINPRSIADGLPPSASRKMRIFSSVVYRLPFIGLGYLSPRLTLHSAKKAQSRQPLHQH